MSVKNIFLRCDCHAETAVFSRYDYDCGDTDYDLSIEDSYCGGDLMGIGNRFKRAWKAFFAEPICYASVCCEDKNKMRKFLEDCLSLMSTESE
jgi:hypothetical protein